MFVFPLIFLLSFVASLKEIFSGNRAGILLFLIFGLSIYTTAMSAVFLMGLRDVLPPAQFFKEFLILIVLIIGILLVKKVPRLHLIDYLTLAFLLLTIVYAILPIGGQTFIQRLIALKSISFFIVVYFAGRFIDIRTVFINKYFNYLLILTIAAGVVVIGEAIANQNLQTITGYADYVYYFFNMEPSGNFGLSTTFESDGGYRRYGSFFSNPLEHAAATILALSVILALFTSDDNKFRASKIGLAALVASVCSIVLAFSRAPLISYLLVIYIYALLTKKRLITKIVHYCFIAGVIYVAYLFLRLDKKQNPFVEIIISTIDFSNPSSVGHVLQWVQGITAIAGNPMGLGLGATGRVAGTLGENVGGENQFIIIGVQAGIIALILYLIVYLLFIKQGLKWFKLLKGNERKLCLAVLLFKLGILIPLFTSEIESSSYISYMNWFLSGLFISVVMKQGIESPQPAPAL
ncbi:O-antigen ligase family protein [Mucilaginibacter ginkgonis]|uniref:O-antigen ligase-like membrane protein n=1 Tax=Mucilaginibacter ginkgonis TaxID=2682091 RepID=A0A6I4I4K0_9SPHI|nr:hypothetical protein [Mucilaginibacter ginkgonis]QQL50876.1 hypothetical protein GO620_005300 [Mucilaginibacter ginkgonis]